MPRFAKISTTTKTHANPSAAKTIHALRPLARGSGASSSVSSSSARVSSTGIDQAYRRGGLRSQGVGESLEALQVVPRQEHVDAGQGRRHPSGERLVPRGAL